MALQPNPCVSHRSRTAGTAAQYVPRNGTAPRIAAKANRRVKLNQSKSPATVRKQQTQALPPSSLTRPLQLERWLRWESTGLHSGTHVPLIVTGNPRSWDLTY